MSVWECDFWVDVHLARIYMLLEIICLYLKVCRDLEEGVLLKPPGDRCCSLHRLSSLKSSLLFFIRPSFFLPAFAFVVLLAVTSRWVDLTEIITPQFSYKTYSEYVDDKNIAFPGSITWYDITLNISTWELLTVPVQLQLVTVSGNIKETLEARSLVSVNSSVNIISRGSSYRVVHTHEIRHNFKLIFCLKNYEFTANKNNQLGYFPWCKAFLEAVFGIHFY